MMKNNLQALSPGSLSSSSFSVFFLLKTVVFLETDLFYECRGDDGGERYGNEMVM